MDSVSCNTTKHFPVVFISISSESPTLRGSWNTLGQSGVSSWDHPQLGHTPERMLLGGTSISEWHRLECLVGASGVLTC